MTFPQAPVPIVDPLRRPRRPFIDQREIVLPIPDQDTQDWLEDSTDLDDTIELWDKKSGIPGLFGAALIVRQARKLAQVFFDFAAGRYRYLLSGRLVPVSRVRLGVLRVAKAQEIAMRDLTRQLVNGEISQGQWYRGMRKMMKDQYRASWIASIGGVENYNRSEAAKMGWAIKPQYRWLDNFLLEIQSGKQPLNGFAIRRAGMYARAGNVIYQNNLVRIAEQNGKWEVRRVLGETENHCHEVMLRPGCIELAAKGFVPMSQFVPIGDAACYSHCLCTVEFR